MKLRFFKGEFSVCRLRDLSNLDLSRDLFFFAKTQDELSLVCSSLEIPANAVRVESGWRMFRIEGQLDFGLVGILAKITGVLAAHGLSVFAVSTFDTDYILIKADGLDQARVALAEAGYEMEA